MALVVRCTTCGKELGVDHAGAPLPPHERADMPGVQCPGTRGEPTRPPLGPHPPL